MISVSHFSSRLEITFNLSATFAPPRIATNGLSGVFTAFPRNRSLSALSNQQLLCQPDLQHLRWSSVLCVRFRMHRLRIHHRWKQGLGESLSVLCLFRSETCILKKDHIAVFHSFYGCFCVRSYDFRISCKFTSCPNSSDKRAATGASVFVFLSSSVFTCQGGSRELLCRRQRSVFDGRKRCNETVLVCDLAIF